MEFDYKTGVVGGLVADWLYSDWSKEKYDTFTALYQIYGVRQYFDFLLDQRKDQEYMAANQLDWSDVHDPRKLSQTSSLGSVYNFVSSNIKRLYKD